MKNKIKKKVKFYMVLSSDKKKHGAFPFSPEGKERAEKYIEKLEKDGKETFKIQKV